VISLLPGIKSIRYSSFFTKSTTPEVVTTPKRTSKKTNKPSKTATPDAITPKPTTPIPIDIVLPQPEAFKRVPKDAASWNTTLGANRCTTLFVPVDEFFPAWDSFLYEPPKTKNGSHRLWLFQMSVSTVDIHEKPKEMTVIVDGKEQKQSLGRIEASFYNRIINNRGTAGVEASHAKLNFFLFQRSQLW